MVRKPDDSLCCMSSIYFWGEIRGFQGGIPHSQPRRLACVDQQYLLDWLLGQYYPMHSRLILLFPGCYRVIEREDERMQLQPIRLQMVAQGLGLLESFLHRCGICSRRRSWRYDIYTPPDPSMKCETDLFQSRLILPGTVVCVRSATSLWYSRLVGRTLPGQIQGLLFLRSSSPSNNNDRIMTE